MSRGGGGEALQNWRQQVKGEGQETLEGAEMARAVVGAVEQT